MSRYYNKATDDPNVQVRGGFGMPNRRTVLGKNIEIIRDEYGRSLGEIRSKPGNHREEAWSSDGKLLGWYVPSTNLTYDQRTATSISQGNTLTALIMRHSNPF